jgi:hypothetical protein
VPFTKDLLVINTGFHSDAMGSITTLTGPVHTRLRIACRRLWVEENQIKGVLRGPFER